MAERPHPGLTTVRKNILGTDRWCPRYIVPAKFTRLRDRRCAEHAVGAKGGPVSAQPHYIRKYPDNSDCPAIGGSEVSPSRTITPGTSANRAGMTPGRLSVPQIAQRLNIGRLAVYDMLEQGLLPGIRLGRRWIVTRHAFEQWERTCGTGFQRHFGANV